MINSFQDKIAKFIATFCYSGLLLKKGPGTVGSFFTVLIILLMSILYKDSTVIEILLFIFSMSIGWWATHHYMKVTGKSDPKEVVIDEVAGQSLTIFISTLFCGYFDIHEVHEYYEYLFLIFLSFLFFRVFDILKPFPVNYFDKIDNAFGVIMDDVVAGLMASAVVIGIMYVIF